MTPARRLLDRCRQYQMAAAASRRRQELALLERIALVQNTPARTAEQARLKREAIEGLVEGVGAPGGTGEFLRNSCVTVHEKIRY